jgi:hypothetical protein
MKYLIIVLLMASLVFTGCAQTSVYEECVMNGGESLEQFSECEGISQDTCEELQGEFQECESACRNDPDAAFCTQQCIQVCQF